MGLKQTEQTAISSGTLGKSRLAYNPSEIIPVYASKLANLIVGTLVKTLPWPAGSPSFPYKLFLSCFSSTFAQLLLFRLLLTELVLFVLSLKSALFRTPGGICM